MQLSHTSEYLLPMLNDPCVRPCVRLWGSVLISTELRAVRKSDKIAQINRRNYITRLRNELTNIVINN